MTTVIHPKNDFALSHAVAGAWAGALLIGGGLLYLFCLIGCSMPEQAETAPLELADLGAAPDMAPPRLRVIADPVTGRRVLWDNTAQAICERQPLCTDCALPWSDNEHYCVPVELTPFALGAWYVDPFCSVRMYGLSDNSAHRGQQPRWAYDFDETRHRAKVYRVRAAQGADLARPFRADLYDPKIPCERVPANDLLTAQQNFKLFVQVEESPPSEWVPWGEAQKTLGGSP